MEAAGPVSNLNGGYSMELMSSKKGQIWQCAVCNKMFASKYTLQDHERIHTGEKPYACSICPKRFRARPNLSTHMKGHMGSKPFVCPQCNKTFATKQQMQVHERVHSGERPFACDVCGRRFTTLGNMKQHRLSHSNERPFLCHLCKKGFTSRGSLANHSKSSRCPGLKTAAVLALTSSADDGRGHSHNSNNNNLSNNQSSAALALSPYPVSDIQPVIAPSVNGNNGPLSGSANNGGLPTSVADSSQFQFPPAAHSQNALVPKFYQSLPLARFAANKQPPTFEDVTLLGSSSLACDVCGVRFPDISQYNLHRQQSPCGLMSAADPSRLMTTFVQSQQHLHPNSHTPNHGGVPTSQSHHQHHNHMEHLERLQHRLQSEAQQSVPNCNGLAPSFLGAKFTVPSTTSTAVTPSRMSVASSSAPNNNSVAASPQSPSPIISRCTSAPSHYSTTTTTPIPAPSPHHHNHHLQQNNNNHHQHLQNNHHHHHQNHELEQGEIPRRPPLTSQPTSSDCTVSSNSFVMGLAPPSQNPSAAAAAAAYSAAAAAAAGAINWNSTQNASFRPNGSSMLDVLSRFTVVNNAATFLGKRGTPFKLEPIEEEVEINREKKASSSKLSGGNAGIGSPSPDTRRLAFPAT